MARQLLHLSGDAGASLRASQKALRRFGHPPRELWPEDCCRPDDPPPAFLFSYAREYAPLAYVRLDPSGADARESLARVKSFLAAGLPVAFGFSVVGCIGPEPDIPFPSCFDTVRRGQSVLAVGYDDARRIRSEKGALRIRNSWGPGWGDGGFGWLPYRYLSDGLAADFWAVLRPDWLSSGEFTAPD
jgi:hypothetical protein